MELNIDRVTKQYGPKIAVDRISLTLTPGVTGLLGANGAGKTTLMRMLCGILRPTSGSISLDGLDVSTEGYRAVLGYLPQDFGYYPSFSALDFLLYLGALKGMERKQAKERSLELVEVVGRTHRWAGSQGASPLSHPHPGAGERQHRAPLHPYCLRCGTHCGPHSDGEGRPAYLRRQRGRHPPGPGGILSPTV